MGIEKIRGLSEKINKKPMMSFIGIFIIVFPLLMLALPYLRSPYASFFQNTGNFFFKNFINTSESLHRDVRVFRTSDKKRILKIDIGFKDILVENGNMVAKLIEFDTQKEGLVPYIFLISLILSSPIKLKKKVKALLYGTLLLHIWVIFKFNMQILDNYNYPNLLFIDLPFPFDTFVYYFNAFIRVTGASSALVIPIIFWVIVAYEKEAVIRIKESFIGKSS
jgi:hypothetical protein